MKICNGCGKELPDHVKFCGQCGGSSFTPLQEAASPAASGEPEADAVEPTAFAGNRGNTPNGGFQEDGSYYTSADGGYYASGNYDPYGAPGSYPAYDAYGNPIAPGGAPAPEQRSGGKKALVATMITLASVLAVLCIVLVVHFMTQDTATSKRTISDAGNGASDEVQDTETLAEATTVQVVTAAPYTSATAASTAAATKAPATTRAATTTAPAARPPVTVAPPAPQPPVTVPTTAPTTAPTTTQASLQAVTAKQDILNLYMNAVNSVKGGSAGYTLKQARSIGSVNLSDVGAINDIMKEALDEAFVPETSGSSSTYTRGSADAKNNIPAWNLQDTGYVTNATCTVSNGRYVVRIEMQSETNPTANSPLSQVSDMITPYDSVNSEMRSVLGENGDVDLGNASFDLTYSNYVIEAEITSEGKLVTLRHSVTMTVTIHNLTIDAGIPLNLDNKSVSWNNSKTYSNFIY